MTFPKELFQAVENIVDRARLVAVFAHGDQLYGGKPYHIHLKSVANTLVRFGHDDKNIISAAYLHDVLEDTSVTGEDLSYIFGPSILALVMAVTNEPGANRKERAEKTYPKIRSTNRATLLKLADRISNLENCILSDDSRLEMYRKEYPGFRAALHQPGQYEIMWKWLDFLSKG